MYPARGSGNDPDVTRLCQQTVKDDSVVYRHPGGQSTESYWSCRRSKKLCTGQAVTAGLGTRDVILGRRTHMKSTAVQDFASRAPDQAQERTLQGKASMPSVPCSTKLSQPRCFHHSPGDPLPLWCHLNLPADCPVPGGTSHAEGNGQSLNLAQWIELGDSHVAVTQGHAATLFSLEARERKEPGP